MPSVLAGRIAIVTGGGRGIGKTIAIGLAAAGADVAVVARTEQEIQMTAGEVCRLGRRSVSLRADLADPRAAADVVRQCAERLGPPEILVNAAAVQGPIGRFDTIDLKEWVRTVHTDLVGPAAMAHAAIPHMRGIGRGKIINISGGGAANARPRFTAYAISKAALIRLTETLGEELRDLNIQVNAIAPGATRTRMTEEVLAAEEVAGDTEVCGARETARTGGTPPERQAALAVFLASAESDHVTGRFLHVNDPWNDLRVPGSIAADLYTLRRVSPVRVGT